jgi:hypothetical protein
MFSVLLPQDLVGSLLICQLKIERGAILFSKEISVAKFYRKKN